MIVTSILLLLACSGASDNNSNASANDKLIELDMTAGQTVFELLNAQHEIKFKQTSMGIFIESINGIKNKSGQAWKFYVNDQPAQVSCNNVVVFEGDKVTWKFE